MSRQRDGGAGHMPEGQEHKGPKALRQEDLTEQQDGVLRQQLRQV